MLEIIYYGFIACSVAIVLFMVYGLFDCLYTRPTPRSSYSPPTWISSSTTTYSGTEDAAVMGMAAAVAASSSVVT